ncbi:helix-turn-helix transcriptional regulator [Streptomyces sp. NPDC060194]|uniref:helix-turn-helix domain-containing protein n=1 Tax=Streptomyces sp. NPDC060194 TaxID=3347069 RepID=UPI003654AE13
MPPRSNPTLRQRRLGVELQKLRVAAGLTADRAAKEMGIQRVVVTGVEAGRAGVSAERVRLFAKTYGCADDDLTDALAEMTVARGQAWWDRFRGQLPQRFADIAELEWHAPRIRFCLTVHLPGLLQTPDHATAVFAAAYPPLSGADADARLRHRLERQQILDRPPAPQLDVILHEAALRMEFGGPAVVRRQLRHLLGASERRAVSLRIIPFKAGGFPGAGQSVTYVEGAVPALDTVALDATHGPEFVDDADQLQKYRGQLDAAAAVALTTEESRTFIARLAGEL